MCLQLAALLSNVQLKLRFALLQIMHAACTAALLLMLHMHGCKHALQTNSSVHE